jgi:hypothetical protein
VRLVTEVRNERSCASASFVYSHGVGRDSFTLGFTLYRMYELETSS